MLVEMALALPLLALIFLGIIDLGLIVREYQVLQNAAREGARYSAQPENQIVINTDPVKTQLAIQQFVVSYAAEEKITINLADVTVNQVYPVPGGCGSEVTVTYTRSTLLLGGLILPKSAFRLTGRSVFYNLYGC